jgi:CheY-specific phosphatase CheX
MATQLEISSSWIAESIRDVTVDVFSTMLGFEVEGVESTGDALPKPINGIASLLSFSGAWVGVCMLVCSEKLAQRLASTLLMSESEVSDLEVMDGLGEMGNIIFGNFKEKIEQSSGRIQLSVPSVVRGQNVLAHVVVKASWTGMLFKLEDEFFEVRVCMTQGDE